MNTRIDTVQATARITNTPAPFWLRALDWLADLDAAYRSAQKLRSMPDERLDDMGISREPADLVMYCRGAHKADADEPVRLRALEIG